MRKTKIKNITAVILGMVLVLSSWKPCVLNADAKTERAEKILYPSVPMGQENYYVYKDSTNSDISAENLSSLN